MLTDFEEWWRDIGSKILPRKGDDMESHAKRVAAATWEAAREEQEE